RRARRRGSARFAGLAEPQETVPDVVPRPSAGAPDGPAARGAPRGARFAGAGEPATPVPPAVVVEDEEAGTVVAETVEHLARLRAEGRTGEAHALLAEAARWPVGRLPLLAAALHRAGLGA
ncbi:hypothetical protein GT045_22060, partial [Streptomyces sp. SID486]|nr:hypothetical protein [Streptomyces sp. SID486]